MKLKKYWKRQRLFAGNLTLFTFFLVQISFIPASYPFNLTPAAEPRISKLSNMEPAAGLCGDKLTLIDYETGRFAVFCEGVGSGVPIEMGMVDWNEGDLQLVPTRHIQDLDGLYILTHPQDPNFLEVIERLPEGGFGRLLRHRDGSGSGMNRDLEFIYEDRAETVTIFDHKTGKFYRTTFTPYRPKPRSVAPSDDAEDSVAELIAAQAPPLKFLISHRENGLSFQPETKWLHSQFEGLFEQEVWMNRRVRGPPAGEIA